MVLIHSSLITHHSSLITHHSSLITHHSSLITHHSSRITIARLPRELRDQLNRRLDNGEPGTSLVAWLNRLPVVNLMLTEHFDGRPINDQNLTEWKQAGFIEWQRHQESCEWVRTLAGEADQIAEEAGIMPLSDRLSSMVTLTLGKLMRDLDSASLTDAASRKDFMQLLKELARLRREDREAARVQRFLQTCGRPSRRRSAHPDDGNLSAFDRCRRRPG